MLPPAYWWSDGAHGSTLYLRYGAVASVSADGLVTLIGAKNVTAQVASREQGKRFVERWVAVNGSLPSQRILDIRERLGIKPGRW